MSKNKKIREPVECRCGYTWTPRKENPRSCPKCGTTAWRIPGPVPPPEARTEAPPPAPIIQEVREELAPVPRIPKKEEKRQAKRDKKDRTPEKFSDRHPVAYEIASNILPRSPLLLFLIGLTFSALSSMIIGNYLFVVDWYQGTIILPWFMGMFTYAGGPGEWFADYWPLLVLLICLFVSVTFAVWSLPWRFAFKDYIVIRGNTKSRDGRIMWSTDNIWVRMWDSIYRTPPRDTVEIWLKHRFFWNPLMPQKGLIKLTLDREIEKPQYEGLFQYTAEERRYRMFTAFGEMITTDDSQQSRPIPLAEINAAFASRSSSLVRDTQKFSLANPSVRIEKLRHGTHIVPDDLREVAELARKVRGE